ncbi:bifunctional inhibitor/lipid-transfer protein/seed storage 2S albumin superfamily protein [Artemisia annua]|uniref:Bifunctional inhibitor/lipid-transfer protein/seed storage 2S albumin superfamily protein n=1 Tax=Artemisia annua TaxID=35608 RepID=A0A2U1ML17_ARTAN|nr:bifunctional inhibitor/lipid-transfer protein/seed storage 2S albumin superfamily protein [Artemisia annua]
MVFRCLVLSLAVAMCALVVPVYSQINNPCSPPMITSFPPCLNLLTNSTTNSSTTPTSDCCNFFKTLMSNGTDCLCLIVRSVPFQIPFNQSLVLSLPPVCGMPGVPLQCKAAAAAPSSPTGPAPAPGNSSTVPGALPPALAPESNSTPTLTPPLPPESNTTPTLTPPPPPEANTTPNLTPPSTGVGSGVPSTNSGSHPTLTPSAAASTYDNLLFILVASEATFMAYLMLF